MTTPAASQAAATPSAAAPLAGGFTLSAISLLLVVLGAVQVPQDDDWTILVGLALLGFLIGLALLSMGISRFVRHVERALDRGNVERAHPMA